MPFLAVTAVSRRRPPITRGPAYRPLFSWAVAASAGLSPLLEANRLLFDGLHLVGGIVLAWLGISAWRNARPGTAPSEDTGSPGRLPRGRTPASAFRASLLSIAANPKAAVFAFAFYPEFLPRHGPVLADALALATFQVLVIDTPYCAGIVLLADRVRPWLSRAEIRRRMERALGAVLVALGIELAATAR